MLIGQRIRELRESKKLSQGDIEKRTGLLRCYTSRVEIGHTVPSIATLEKYAAALGVPLHQFFHDDKTPPRPLGLEKRQRNPSLWGLRGKRRRELQLFIKALSRMNERERQLLLSVARDMARGTGDRPKGDSYNRRGELLPRG